MLNYKRNGDIYFGKVKVYNGYRQSPVRWLFALGAVAALVVFIAIATLFLGGFGRGY